jgi:hypothetical protein
LMAPDKAGADVFLLATICVSAFVKWRSMVDLI